MKRAFWIKGVTCWDTIKINTYCVLSVIWNALLMIVVVVFLCLLLWGMFYKLPREIIGSYRQSESAYRQKLAEEANVPKTEFAGKRFSKFTLEGHDYWIVEDGNYRSGFCHSESCPCRTNKVEAAQ